MRLTEDYEFRELSRRMKLAQMLSTAAEQIEVMGDFLNANIPSLPEPLRSEFRRTLRLIAQKTVMG